MVLPSVASGSSSIADGYVRQNSDSSPRDEAEELNNWKENVPMLYRFLAAHTLEWPSLCLDWTLGSCKGLAEGSSSKHSPESRAALSAANSDEVVKTIVLSTYTDKSSASHWNAILYVDVLVPISGVPVGSREYQIHKDHSGVSYGRDSNKFYIHRVIPRPDGEANSLAVMPHKENVVASIGANGSTYLSIYEETSDGKVSSVSDCIPSCVPLKHHNQEGWALSWSWCQPTLLATGADDAAVCIWDIDAATKSIGINSSSVRNCMKFPISSSSRVSSHDTQPLTRRSSTENRQQSLDILSELSPLAVGRQHTAPVGAVAWRPDRATEVLSVGDDGCLVVWDIRTAKSGLIAQPSTLDTLPINCVSVAPTKSYVVATGGESKEICIWDIRDLSRSLYKLSGHEMPISRLEFSYNNDRYIISCGHDRFALVWDLTAIGKEQAPLDAASGPPELIFKHAGHATTINDISWCKDSDFEGMIASVSEDNQLQLWFPNEVIYEDFLEDDDEQDEGSYEGDDDFSVE